MFFTEIVNKKSKSEIYLKWTIIRDTDLASQQFVFRMEVTLSESLNSNEANKKISKAIKCNQYGYATIAASKLRAHLKTNSEEKSYKCNQCDFASSRADNLKAHSKTHSGEKSHKGINSVSNGRVCTTFSSM